MNTRSREEDVAHNDEMSLFALDVYPVQATNFAQEGVLLLDMVIVLGEDASQEFAL